MGSVGGRPVERSYEHELSVLRTSPDLVAERARLAAELDRAPDKTLALAAEMPGMKHHGEGHAHGHGHVEIEWEDTMQLHNRMTSPRNMFWKLVDRETGAANHAIDWSFKVG